jgi:CubicO group peptidase (beta-lactamase class C family)
MRTRIFEPLGMKNTYTSARDAMANPDHAVPHNRFPDGQIAQVKRADVDSVRAAGSINSSVRDLGQWLRLHLADGQIDGKRLIPANTLKETRRSQMIVRQEGRWLIFFPEKATRHLTYGLGWFVHDYRGQFAVSHGGTLDGFRAQTVLVPDRKLGVVVLGNLTPSTFPEALTKTLLDHLLGLKPEDWNAHYTAADKKTETDRLAANKKKEADRKKDTKPSRELDAYAGVYSEPAYGRAEVTCGAHGLQLKWGKIVVQLDHYHFDTFTGHVIGPSGDDVIRYQRQTYEVQFRLGASGNVEGMRFLDQDFTRGKK